MGTDDNGAKRGPGMGDDLAIEILLEKCRMVEEEIRVRQRELADLYGTIESLRAMGRPADGAEPAPRDDGPGPSLKDPSVPKAAARVLRHADGPMTAARIAEAVNANRREEASHSSVSVALRRMQADGRAKSVPGAKPYQWVIGDGDS